MKTRGIKEAKRDVSNQVSKGVRLILKINAISQHAKPTHKGDRRTKEESELTRKQRKIISQARIRIIGCNQMKVPIQMVVK